MPLGLWLWSHGDALGKRMKSKKKKKMRERVRKRAYLASGQGQKLGGSKFKSRDGPNLELNLII